MLALTRATRATNNLLVCFCRRPAAVQIPRAATTFPVSKPPTVTVIAHAVCSLASTTTARFNAAEKGVDRVMAVRLVAASVESARTAMTALPQARPLVSSVSYSCRAIECRYDD